MRPRGTSTQLEERRRHAVELLARGGTFRAVAQRVGSSLSSVVRWSQAHRHEGTKGLKSKPTPGRPCRLSASQKKKLETLLLRGPGSAGYSTELWTLRRIGEQIRKHFGVRYSVSAVWRLLVVDLNWSAQKPARRATQRDEVAIEEWKRKEWPRLKKERDASARISHSWTKAGSS